MKGDLLSAVGREAASKLGGAAPRTLEAAAA